MASILTIINKNSKERSIQSCNEVLKHRGENETEFFEDEILSLGFNNDKKEKILNNPLLEKLGLKIIYDGDFYNQKELLAELSDKEFMVRSDVEILAQLYEKYHLDMFNHINGEVAVLVYDMNRKLIHIARDRFGVKPMYYTKNTDDGSLMFASELKAFVEHPHFIKKLNDMALKSYLTFQYSPGLDTFFENVYKLEHGCVLTYDIEREQMTVQKYYEYKINPQEQDPEVLEKEILRLLTDAVERRKTGEKIGTFLSGGIDSSLVTTILRPDMTFTIGYDDEYGIFTESQHALELSKRLGIPNRKYTLTGEEAFEHLGEIQYYTDEPHGNLSTIPLYFLSKMAKEEVDVVQVGSGADEFFGGYSSFIDGPKMRKYKKVPWAIRKMIKNMVRNNTSKTGKLLREAGSRVEDYFIGEANIFTPEEAKNIVTEPYKNGYELSHFLSPLYHHYKNAPDLVKKQMIDINLFMPGDICVKEDRMAAAASLGLRAPFFDQRIVDLSESLTAEMKTKDGIEKYILRKMAMKQLPEDWAKRKKLGFPVSMRYWLKHDKIYQRVREVFVSDEAKQFFNIEKIVGLLEEHYKEQALNQRYIYLVYAFLTWYDEYFKKR